MLYMVIENYRNGDAAPVYRRFRERGRLMPDGLHYVSSWVTSDLKRCFQIMECDEEDLLRTWIQQWDDLVAFEYALVISSADASSRIPNDQ